MLLLTGMARAGQAVALIWGGGPAPADAARWLQRWEAEAGDYRALLALAPGYPKVVDSASMPGLKPGFHVVLLGVCEADAGARALAVLEPLHPGAYTRTVRGEPDGCPTLPHAAAPVDRRVVEEGGSWVAVVTYALHIEGIDGGESAVGATEAVAVAIGRDATGARTGFVEVGEQVSRPSGGFGSWATFTVHDVASGAIVVDASRRRSTVECGQPGTDTRSRVRLDDGRLVVESSEERVSEFCIE